MIEFAQPSLVFNDLRATAYYQMQFTRNVENTDTLEWITSTGVACARQTPEGKLRNVVLNCHGNAAWMLLGEGVSRLNTWMFQRWEGLVDTIWTTGCKVAAIDTGVRGHYGDGNLFCCEIAKFAQCTVVAGTQNQSMRKDHVYPYGKLDPFEGLVMIYDKSGSVRSVRLPGNRVIGALIELVT